MKKIKNHLDTRLAVCEKHKAAQIHTADEERKECDLEKELEPGEYKQEIWHWILLPHNF